MLLALGTAHSEEPFVNIHSGNAMAQGAGLAIATNALKQKATDLIPGVSSLAF